MSLTQESKPFVSQETSTKNANIALTTLDGVNLETQLEDSLMMPEGGLRAWSVTFGSFLTLFATWGIINSYVSVFYYLPWVSRTAVDRLELQGVFQKQYTKQILTTSSPSEISLIGALQLFICYGLGPFVGKAFDAHGTKVSQIKSSARIKAHKVQVLLPLGGAMTFLSLLLLSFCQSERLYQFMICHGVLFGTGCALV